MRPDLVETEVPDGFTPPAQMPLLGKDGVGLRAGRFQPGRVGLVRVVAELRAASNMAQPAPVPFGQQGAEFLLRLSRGVGFFKWHPLDRFASGVVFDRDTGNGLAIPRPQTSYRVLAVVENLGVGVTA